MTPRAALIYALTRCKNACGRKVERLGAEECRACADGRRGHDPEVARRRAREGMRRVRRRRGAPARILRQAEPYGAGIRARIQRAQEERAS